MNNLYNKHTCASCHNSFMCGFDNNFAKICPFCKTKTNVKKNASNGCDNIYWNDGCPALMSDTRFLTYHNSTKELTYSLQKIYGIKNPNKFREFMQKNGSTLIDFDRTYLLKNNTCNPRTACSSGWGHFANKCNI